MHSGQHRRGCQPSACVRIFSNWHRQPIREGVQEAEQAQQRADVRAALEGGLQEPRNQRQWQDSAQGEAVAMVESFARGHTHAPHGSALHALLDLGFPVTPDGAALLLKRIGYWPRNFPNAVVRLPLSPSATPCAASAAPMALSSPSSSPVEPTGWSCCPCTTEFTGASHHCSDIPASAQLVGWLQSCLWPLSQAPLQQACHTTRFCTSACVAAHTAPCVRASTQSHQDAVP